MAFSFDIQKILYLTFTFLPLVLTLDLSTYPAIFNFGDSNSDTGDLAATTLIPPLGPPYGQTYFNEPTGRFCDGRLVIDFLRESTGKPHLNPYLNSIGAPSFQTGCNFASGGSTILPPNTAYANPFFFDAQISQFIRFKAKTLELMEKGGGFSSYLPSQDSFDTALYMIDYGQNDLHGGLDSKSEQQMNAFIPIIMMAFENGIKKLYIEGARNFFVYNTGPLGCLASVIKKFGKTAECVEWVNNVATSFNTNLHNVCTKFCADFPEAHVTFVDIYSIKRNLISNFSRYGFTEPLAACCGTGEPPLNYNSQVPCGQSKAVNGKTVTAKSCIDPALHVSWDGGHYTEAANRFISDQILTGKYGSKPNEKKDPVSISLSPKEL